MLLKLYKDFYVSEDEFLWENAKKFASKLHFLNWKKKYIYIYIKLYLLGKSKKVYQKF